jgi:dolichol-phosphate mannosyltransferase
MNIAVIIPTYNEKNNIEKLASRIFGLGISDLGIVVVDDNSPDGTGEILREMKKSHQNLDVIHRDKKRGLGTAYIEGFNRALEGGAEYIFEMDADFSHDPEMLPVFLKELDKFDLVVGSRYKGGIRIINWPLRRLMLSILANKYTRLVTGMKLTDATSGFKGYRRRVLEAIDLGRVRSNGYSFQIEMKYRAHKKNFSISEVPIVFVDRHSGSSKMSKNIIWEAFFIVWKLKLGLIK